MQKRIFPYAIITLFFILIACESKNGDDIEIFAVRYGESYFKSRAIFQDGDKTKLPFAWLFWVIKTKNGAYLVDCGIQDKKFLDKWNITQYSRPVDLLRLLGLDNDDITGIIVSHLHADHFDGALAFPNAKFYLQKREYAAIKNILRRNANKNAAKGYYRHHLKFLKKIESQNRLVLIDGDYQINPVISIKLEPYHTKGTQTVIVKLNDKKVYIVSDNAYFFKNIAKLRPIGSSIDHSGNSMYLQELKELSSSGNIVLPGHDPAIFENFKEVNPNIVQIN